ncbi:septum formation family protein [uncultured Cellulomonas sp.]|uniref:septum formation family protein n=1 Tax=uncultured Cellulomonas sp. TaxID=189682 RepID=UPI0026384949|nr:septum formation family protein [uncultured Cellulomonas sp.]
MSRSTRLAAVGVLASTALLVTGCSLMGGVEPERDEETGEITEAVEADAFAIRVGDCLDYSDEAPAEEGADELEEVSSVPTVPCGEAHDSEVYASHQLDGDEYPGDDAIVASADDMCFADFQPFVGTAYEESTLDFTYLAPTSQSWELGDDREVLCIVTDPQGGVTGTLEGVQH